METQKRTVGGWSEEARRAELERLIEVAMKRYRLSRSETLEAIANRFMVALNTVQGWTSKPRAEAQTTGAKRGKARTASKRKPPSWMVIDILRYELDQMELQGFEAFIPGARTDRELAKVLHAPAAAEAPRPRSAN